MLMAPRMQKPLFGATVIGLSTKIGQNVPIIKLEGGPMPGALDGVRIVDLTTMISGPIATMMLADQGADVIKVEPKSGDLVRVLGPAKGDRTATFLAANRNKRSLVLNLKTDEGLAALKKLVSTADVVVQNFRPGAAERMGIGEVDLRKERADLIYVSISGFGETGPYAKKRVYDPVIQALSGLAAIQADRDTGRPRMIRTIIPDKLTAVTAAQAITAALFARERTGEGQHIKLSMLDAMIAFLWAEGLVALTFPGGEKHAARAQLSQDLIYKTQDGYITVGAVSDDEWNGLCAALDQPQWLEDERFNTPSGRVVNAPERLALTQEVLQHKTSADWLSVLDSNQVPCAPILDRTSLLDHPQIQANQIVEEQAEDELGAFRLPRPAARFSGTQAETRRQAPHLGEHTAQLLAELGYDQQTIDELITARAASNYG